MKTLMTFFKKNNTVSEETKNYFTAAKDWHVERYESILVSLQRYRFISVGLGVLLALSLTAFISILPLKEPIYRLIEVNKETGEVKTLSEVGYHTYQDNWPVIRYFIHQYILNRYLYSHEDIKRTFNIALSMSAKPIADEYAQQILDTNPKSPLNVLNKSYYRDVTQVSINRLTKKSAIVRFQTETHNKNNVSDSKREDFQAAIQWEFQPPTDVMEERDDNPLGFKVVHFQVSRVFGENA